MGSGGTAALGRGEGKRWSVGAGGRLGEIGVDVSLERERGMERGREREVSDR